MSEFKVGDPVEVIDEGLALLRKLMGGKPNHYGTVAEIWDDGTILVAFQLGKKADNHSQVAPYPPSQVRKRTK